MPRKTGTKIISPSSAGTTTQNPGHPAEPILQNSNKYYTDSVFNPITVSLSVTLSLDTSYQQSPSSKAKQITMGCHQSKYDDAFRTVDDSVHTGIKIARKKQEAHGEPVGYKPRQAHPMLDQNRSEKESEQEATTQETALT